MATIHLESFIPARCCTAPLMPIAMYRSGATTLPVCPTCIQFGQQPASTAAREAPTAASPNASASLYITLKFYLLFTPRPPETTMRAVVSSGLLLSLFSSPTKVDFSLQSPMETYSIGAVLVPASGSAKAEGLTVKKSMGSSDLTLVNALPAQVGLTKVFPSYTITTKHYNNISDIPNRLRLMFARNPRNSILAETTSEPNNPFILILANQTRNNILNHISSPTNNPRSYGCSLFENSIILLTYLPCTIECKLSDTDLLFAPVTST